MVLIASDNGQVVLDTTQCLLRVQLHQAQSTRFYLQRLPGFYHCPVREAALPVYGLNARGRDEIGQATDFSAYFCDFVEDHTRTIELHNQHQYFFTAELSGCSIGIAPINGFTSLTVGHANEATAGGLMWQLVDQLLGSAVRQRQVSLAERRRMQQRAASAQMERTQSAALQGLGFTPDGIVPPALYGRPFDRDNDMRTTLIGFRDDGQWSFIRQTFNVDHIY